MRILKQKIVRARTGYTKIDPMTRSNTLDSRIEENTSKALPGVQKNITWDKSSIESFRDNSRTFHDVKSTKNIVKNYGRAICNFILSPVSRLYLDEIIRKDHSNILAERFISYINERKESIDCIERLKNLLIQREDDDEEEAAFKSIFKKLGEIFIKYFSVNWIYSGRLTYKQAHVDFRFKMLRRLRNPENFTYLKAAVKKK